MIFLKGMLMGVCDIIPGVSGGTIALITGIYERLVTAVGNIGAAPLMHLVRGEKEAFSESISRMDPFFLLVLVAGIGLAALIMSWAILYLLGIYAGQTYAFFFGLILASSVLIYLRIEEVNHVHAAGWILLGLVAGWAIAGLDQASLGHSLPVIFFTGMVAICAMVLPGISGAYITLLMNQYEYLLNAIHTLAFAPIIAFACGGVVGLLSFTRVLKFLLRSYHAQSLAFLTGLMLGSTRLLYDRITLAGGTAMTVGAFVVIGAALVAGIELAWRRYYPPGDKEGA
jgi:putative membrane protein